MGLGGITPFVVSGGALPNAAAPADPSSALFDEPWHVGDAAPRIVA